MKPVQSSVLRFFPYDGPQTNNRSLSSVLRLLPFYLLLPPEPITNHSRLLAALIDFALPGGTIPLMTVTADAKKRVVLPGAAAGDVFTCEKTAQGIVLRRIHRSPAQKKITKAQALKAIRSWKFKPAMSWEKLRKLTREV
jgi:hypothetical protein